MLVQHIVRGVKIPPGSLKKEREEVPPQRQTSYIHTENNTDADFPGVGCSVGLGVGSVWHS